MSIGRKVNLDTVMPPAFASSLVSAPLRLSSACARKSSFSSTSLQLQYARRQRWLGLYKKCTLSAPHVSYHFRRRERRHEATDRAQKIGETPTSSPPPPAPQRYSPPTTGLISRLPPSWIPYAELARLGSPTGTYYLFLPCFFSTLLAAPLTTPVAPPSTIFATSALFYLGALIMRGAGCTVNDLWDRNLDPHVARTRLRPIARGAINVQQAIAFLGVQLLFGLGILLQVPSQCLYYGVPSLVLVGAYPLAKRVTNYPQFVLGLTFSWGAIMGFPALGIDLLSNTAALISAACLYGSCVAWTVVYDMIYAYQDIRDDAKVGIKSIALAQESNAKIFMTAVSVAQIALLAGAGAAAGAGPLYFLGTCACAGATSGYMIKKVNLKKVEDCWHWFQKGAWFTGGAISMGLIAEYFAQYIEWY